MISERQISRIGVVGSNEVTGPIIEASWRRFLEIFDTHIQNQPYLLGYRPGAGDFAYQAKCLRRLRESYASLDGDARSRADATLDGTGCESLFEKL